MDVHQYGQFSSMDLEQFLQKSNMLQCKIVGMIKTLFKHKRYIIEVFMGRKAVIRCYKRYNQFQALHELIKMKYKNYKMKELPSKIQIFGKEQTRKMYFQDLLNQIIKDHSQQAQNGQTLHETSRRLLSIIYLFFTLSIDEQKLKNQKKLQKKSELIKEFEQVKASKYQVQEQLIQTKSQRVSKKLPQFDQLFPKQKSPNKKHKMSLDLGTNTEIEFRPRSNSLKKQFVNSVKQVKTHINEFQIKFSHETQWKKRFVQIKDSSLFLYVNRLDNYFKTHIELYRIRVEYLKRNMNLVDHFCEKMEFDLHRTFKEDFSILSLYHQHDCDKILIRKPVKTGQDPHYSLQVLSNLKDSLIEASQKSPLCNEYEGVFNPIGKLFLFIHKINLSWKKHTDQETIRIRIKTGAMVYQSRPIVYTNQIHINQGFLIPISNTFEIVKIECYSIKDEGWVNDDRNLGKIRGAFSFNMVQFLTKPQRYLVNKLHLKLQTQQSKVQRYETKLEISIQNYSDFSSVYSESFANQHDGTPLRQIQGLDDLDDLAMTVQRVLRILGTIALLIQAFWRNVYLFKYPRMGYMFFAIVLMNAVFFDVNDIVRQFVAFVLFLVIYQQRHVNFVISYLLNRYLFCKLHPNFKKPLMLSTNQVSFLKWSNHLKYVIEDYEMVQGRLIKKSEKKRTIFNFVVHGRNFTVTQDEQSFFEKMKQAKKIIQLVHKMINTVVCALQKVGNILSWVDYKRTALIASLLLILTGIASGWVVRILVSLFCIHRFYKGLFFYREKHYVRNRMFAVYSLRYILQKRFPNIIGDRKNHKNLSLQQLDDYISDLVFPIHDQASQKILKLQMDQIMGVYLEPQALYPKALKKNCLKVGNIINMVQSCQSRLKLKIIGGQQGITNQFQQLKQETRQVPIIDIWLQEAIINFIMNTPSQLFMAFHKGQLHKQVKNESQQSSAVNSPERKNEQIVKNTATLSTEDFEPCSIGQNQRDNKSLKQKLNQQLHKRILQQIGKKILK